MIAIGKTVFAKAGLVTDALITVPFPEASHHKKACSMTAHGGNPEMVRVAGCTAPLGKNRCPSTVEAET